MNDQQCPTCGLKNPGPEHMAYEPQLCSDRPKAKADDFYSYRVEFRASPNVNWVTAWELHEHPGDLEAFVSNKAGDTAWNSGRWRLIGQTLLDSASTKVA